MTKKHVKIDSLPESARRHSGYDAVVCVDVLLSATTLVTAVAQGRRVFAASDPGHAARLRSVPVDALLLTDILEEADDVLRFAGPSWLAHGGGRGRHALVYVSPLARMMAAAAPRARVYVACLRNLDATANELALRHRHVAILGAGDGGEICSEDQMAAAWLAVRLQQRGFELEGRNTVREVQRWGTFEPALVGLSRSAERLRSSGRGADVEFVLHHVNDLNVVCSYAGGEMSDRAAGRKRLAEGSPTRAHDVGRSAPGH